MATDFGLSFGVYSFQDSYDPVLLIWRRNWHGPRLQEADIDIFLGAPRSQPVHFRLLGLEVNVEVFVRYRPFWGNAHETVGECAVELQNAAISYVGGNRQHNRSLREDSAHRETQIIQGLGEAVNAPVCFGDITCLYEGD